MGEAPPPPARPPTAVHLAAPLVQLRFCHLQLFGCGHHNSTPSGLHLARQPPCATDQARRAWPRPAAAPPASASASRALPARSWSCSMVRGPAGKGREQGSALNELQPRVRAMPPCPPPHQATLSGRLAQTPAPCQSIWQRPCLCKRPPPCLTPSPHLVPPLPFRLQPSACLPPRSALPPCSSRQWSCLPLPGHPCPARHLPPPRPSPCQWSWSSVPPG